MITLRHVPTCAPDTQGPYCTWHGRTWRCHHCDQNELL